MGRGCGRILRSLAVAVLVASFARCAHAQLIQNEFPADIPGYAPSLSDSVVNRMLLEDQNQGVEFNSFVFRPSVSESDGFNSNTLGAAGSGSAEANTAASLRVILRDARRGEPGARGARAHESPR